MLGLQFLCANWIHVEKKASLSFIRAVDQRIYMDVLVVPNSRKNNIVGVHGNRIKIQIHAPPEHGKANKLLVEYLRYKIGLSALQIELVKGSSSREKTLLISGIDPDSLALKLDLP